MVAGSRWIVTAAVSAALVLGCDPYEPGPSPPPTPDFVILTTDAASTTWTDDAPNVSIYGMETLTGGLSLNLNVTGDAATSRTFRVSFAPVPTSLPADVMASFTYTVGGVTYSNTNASLHVTEAVAMTYGHVAGSFTGVVLSGPSTTLTVSGSFDAMVL
jgi:hypothetical protein